jgi:hypothetical protein
MEVKKQKYQTTEFLVKRLDVLNNHAKKAFTLQQIGSVIAFIVVLVGFGLAYVGKLEIAIIQSISTVAVSSVTYLFYRQSNRANDNANKFAMVSIKFNEAWNIVELAMKHAGYLEDAKSRNEAVQKIIDRQLEISLSDKLWKLQLDLQQAPSVETEENEQQKPG